MAESSWVQERSGESVGSLLTMASAAMEPWKSSDTVGMRTARPVDAFSVQSEFKEKASAALGEKKSSSRSPKRSVEAAFEMYPPSARQRSRRAPSVACHRSAKSKLSWAYRLVRRVSPPKAEDRAPPSSCSQSSTLRTSLRR